jgi:2Fe-2S ferredoxin
MMTQIVFVTADGQCLTIDATEGLNVMEAARRAGIFGIIGECGGACSCATCHVYVDESWSHRTGPATGSEADMLEFADEVRPLSRLSCQIKVTPELDGLTLSLPAGQGD